MIGSIVSPSLADRIVGAVRSVVRKPAPLHEPEFAGNEWIYVKECLDTGWVSTAGKFVERFETMLTETTGAAHAIATVNGTAALHAALIALGVRSGDEVIVPSLTFVATANAVAHANATPHFADAATDTLGLDPARLDAHLNGIGARDGGRLINKATRRPIAAVVCVHIFGHPVDLDALAEVCRRHGVPLIEDATESLGSTYKGRPTGRHGKMSVLSFNGNKIVTTGGGGAIVTDDPELAQRARHLTTTAKKAHAWEYVHDAVGYNYRLPNINAALGCAQLERLADFVERKRRVADAYHEAFSGIDGVQVVREPQQTRSNYWLNSILLEDDRVETRDAVLQSLNDEGLMSRPAWRPMHMLEMYHDAPRTDLPVTESLYRRLVCLPSSAALARNQRSLA